MGAKSRSKGLDSHQPAEPPCPFHFVNSDVQRGDLRFPTGSVWRCRWYNLIIFSGWYFQFFSPELRLFFLFFCTTIRIFWFTCHHQFCTDRAPPTSARCNNSSKQAGPIIFRRTCFTCSQLCSAVLIFPAHYAPQRGRTALPPLSTGNCAEVIMLSLTDWWYPIFLASQSSW